MTGDGTGDLAIRLRQQTILADFGVKALHEENISTLLQLATELCAQGLETPFTKVLEYMPDDKRLLVRAGIGWASGTIGQVSYFFGVPNASASIKQSASSCRVQN